jgi:hypothetical protein
LGEALVANVNLPTIYVHGAGEQYEPAYLKRVLDSVLLGHLDSETHLAYFADILHDPPREPPAWIEAQATVAAAEAVGAVAPTTRVFTADLAATSARTTIRADSAASAIDALARPQGVREYVIGPTDELARRAVAEAGVPATASKDAYRLAKKMIRRASPPIQIEAVNVPDVAFRIILRQFAQDVLAYLFRDDIRDRMRASVGAALQGFAEPIMVVAHSLGTIVTYDVLASGGMSSSDVRLVTLGCPLGIEDVQVRLVGGGARPIQAPAPITSWHNFASTRDPVALSKVLATDYGRIAIKDKTVNLPGVQILEHDLDKYLSLEVVKAAILT